MSAIRELVRFILTNPQRYEWSLQGMGMLRLHMESNTRLHIWDSRFRVSNVSMIHDHLQWALDSTVVAGVLVNRRYVEDEWSLCTSVAPLAQYMFTVLKPGYGCYHKTEPQQIGLRAMPPETYAAHIDGPDVCYRQRPNEIHETDAANGTVTVMKKTPTEDESARVFWRLGTEWVSAEPRKATPEEVACITAFSLAKWFQL